MPQRRKLATLFFIVFTDLVGFGIVIPLLPLYAESYHPAAWVFGLLMASYSGMQFLFAPILGKLSDRVGRRPVLLISLVGSASGYVLFALAHSVAALFASRIVAGIAGANIATAQAVIADLTPPEERARGMGLIGAAFGLGFIAGPAIAGFVVHLGQAAPGVVAATFSFAALLLAAILLPESLPPEKRGAGSTGHWGIARLAEAWKERDLVPVFAIGFAVVTGFAAFEVTFAQFLHERLALSQSHVAFLFVYVGVIAAVVQGGLVGRLARRLGESTLVLSGLALTAVGLGALSLARGLLPILLALPVMALGQGLTMPSLSALASRLASEDRQGSVLGAFQGIASFARVIGPFAGEVALGRWGVGAPPLGAAALAVLAAGGAASLLGRRISPAGASAD